MQRCWLESLTLLCLSAACSENSTSSVGSAGATEGTIPGGEASFQYLGIASLSDEQLAASYPYLEFEVSGGVESWECIDDVFGGECRPNSGKLTRPGLRPGFLHLRFDGALLASICGDTGGCEAATVTRSGDMLLIQGNGREFVQLRKNQAGTLVGSYSTQRSVILLDVGHTAVWKSDILAAPSTTSPKTSSSAKWALDPIVLSFDQPVWCDSVRAQLLDLSGQPVAAQQRTDCEIEPRAVTPGLKPTTRALRIYPQSAWEREAYQVQLLSALGVSGIAVTPTTESVVLEGRAVTAQDLDFEGDSLVGWYRSQTTGGFGCSMTQTVQVGESTSILPVSGAKFLTCDTGFEEGYFGAKAQLRVPARARTLSFSAASRYPGESNELVLWDWNVNLEARVAREGEFVLAKHATIQVPDDRPKEWTGWHRVRVDLPQGLSFIELDLSLAGCQIPTPGCQHASHLALDDLRFE